MLLRETNENRIDESDTFTPFSLFPFITYQRSFCAGVLPRYNCNNNIIERYIRYVPIYQMWKTCN